MKKTLSIIMLTLLVVSLMIGCAKATETPVPAPTEAPAVENTVEAEPTVEENVAIPTIVATSQG